jgi:transcription elongation factor GreA
MSEIIYLTREGRAKMLEELETLKNVRKPETTNELVRAREHGDLKENFEYHAAKEALGNIMRRIGELESKLSRVRLIEDQGLDVNTIFIGAKVTVKDEDGDTSQYTIVDTEESDPAAGKISVQSPLAQGLMGHKVGETVKITLPTAKIELKIIKIER